MPHEPSPTKRPGLGSRNKSAPILPREARHSGISPNSPLTPPSTSHKAQPKIHRSHAVGHSRVHHPRTSSYGKNLNKLARNNSSLQVGDAPASGRHHRRAHSHTPSTSPGTTNFKRVGSNVSLKPNHSHVSLRKNHSHVTFKRDHPATEVTSPTRPARQNVSSEGKRGKLNGSVQFNIGDDEQDEGWTEESASQSPVQTRINSANVTPEKGHNGGMKRQETSPVQQSVRSNTELDRDTGRRLSHTRNSKSFDSDAITARILQRHPPQNVPPQMSTVSATVAPPNHSPHWVGESHTSTLQGTPAVKEEGISRFMAGSQSTYGGGSGSPRPASKDPQKYLENGKLDIQKRAQSMGNLTSHEGGSVLGAKGRPDSDAAQSSRTQQKLWLQRASSNLEPHQPVVSKMAPGMRPGTGSMLSSGTGFGAGRDARLQRLFDQTGLEYLVIRRYRNPVGDAITRLNELPGSDKHRRIPPRLRKTFGEEDMNQMGLSQSLREPRSRTGVNGTGKSGSKVRFAAISQGSKDDSRLGEGDDVGLRDNERSDEMEVLRRLWEDRLEVATGVEE